MNKPQVTILIPNYKTLRLTKLCLQLIRKFTDPQRIRIIVIDNDSADESLEYLRDISWIELIERRSQPEDTPPLSHARALDLGLERVETPYLLSLHTDTLIKHPDWLDFLLEKMTEFPDTAGVGSWKLEQKPWVKRILKRIEYGFKGSYYKIIAKKNHVLEDKDKNFFYLRSHCALYNKDTIARHGLNFAANDETAGKIMHKKLEELGYRMVFLTSEELCRYVVHLNHATAILHPELGSRHKTIVKGKKRFKRELIALHAENILAENDLNIG